MKNTFTWFAAGLGLLISLILVKFAPGDTGSGFQLPLLTALVLSEFGFLVNAIAAGICVRDMSVQGMTGPRLFLLLANLMLAVYLLQTGLKLWPGFAGS